MRVLVAADMEGVAGIDDFRVCSPAYAPSYRAGCELMTDEVLVAIAALRDAGVDEIVVGDWHMVGSNIRRDRLPAGIAVHRIAELVLSGAQPSISASAGGPVDAIVLLGQHASQSSKAGFASHTIAWGMDVSLDGEPLSESQVFAQALAAEAIPALVVTGDDRMLAELRDGELDRAETVVAKRAINRARAASLDLAAVHEQIATAIGRALQADIAPPRPRDYPAELVVAFEGKELVRRTVDAPEAMLAGVLGAVRDSALGRGFRLLLKLMPPPDGPRGKPLRRRAGDLISSPVFRRAEAPWLADAGLGAPGKG